MSGGGFAWPWEYDFPPFFTLQPNLSTRAKQLESWARLVLDYCHFHKIYSLDLGEAAQSPLFVNSKLNRRLSVEGIQAVFDHLEKLGHLEWADKGKRRCRVYWRTPEEWGKLIYDWVLANGFKNTVCTLFELTDGDETVGESFHGLEKETLVKGLKSLEATGRAELMGGEGVKFF